MTGTATVPEFSRPVQADRIGREGLNLAIEAKAGERAALARRFGLLSLTALKAQCRLRPVAGGMIELTGTLFAELEQECVVSLAPVAVRIEEPFESRYALDVARYRAAEPEELIDMEAEDPPEAIDAGTIDLGEAVAQQLAVTLDPFPRAPGAAFADHIEFAGERAEADGDPSSRKAGADGSSPFAVLAKFKNRR